MAALHEPGCDTCALSDAVERRDFLRDAVRYALGTIGALALLAPGAAAAAPLAFVSGRGTRAAKKYPIPASDGVAIDKDESVIVARFQGKAYAFSLACPHQNTALKWDAKDTRFQCPKHKSRYTPTGVFIEGRATRGLDRFAVTREGDDLAVNLDLLYRQDKHPAEWEAAVLVLAAEK